LKAVTARTGTKRIDIDTDWSWLDHKIAEAIRKPSEQPIDEWLHENVSLDTTSPIQGQYDVANTPQLREPLKSFQDEIIRMVTMVGPNQGGRTKAMEGASMWAIVNRPGPMQWNTYKDEAAKEFAEQRWWPQARSCESIIDKLPADHNKARIQSVIFSDGMPFKIQGCAESNLEEKSIQTQFNDECWQWPIGRLAIAHKRCNVSYAWNYKVMNGSIPGVDGDDFDLLWKAGSMGEWSWRCLKCGRTQRPRWGKRNQRGGLQWERDATTRPGKEWDLKAVAKTVRYSCEYCNEDYPDNARSRRQLNEGALYVHTNPDAPDWHKSYRFNVLSVNWPGITWAQWVVEFLQAVQQFRNYGNIEPLRQFWTRRQTEAWDESKHVTGNQKVARADYSLGSPNIYIAGQWESESIRFMGNDKQQWGYPYVLRACRPNGESRLIDRGVTEADCLNSYDEIEAKAKEFGVAEQCVLIDSGFEANEVYAAAAMRGWTCMKGVDRELFKHINEIVDQRTRMIKRVVIELPYSEEKWADPFTGTERQQINRRVTRGRAVMRLARRYDWINLHIKNLLSAFKQGNALYWGIPDDVGAEYIKQINAETRQTIITSRNRKQEWWTNMSVTTKDGKVKATGSKRPNHAWDCECMILVAMCLQRLVDLSEWQAESIDVDTL